MEKPKRTNWKKKYLESESIIKDLEDKIVVISETEKEKSDFYNEITKNNKRSNKKLLEILSLITAIIVAIFIFFQTRILSKQTEIFENQTEILISQDSLISDQNKLFRKQNDKFDLQNELFKLQNELVGIQNDKTETQNSLVDIQNQLFQQQNKRIDQQTNLQEAERRSSLVFLFNNVLDKIDEELKDSLNINNSLSSQLIGRIIALTHALKPYKYLENDLIIQNPVSPERGQLLISLLNSDIEDNTLTKIFEKADFKYSELQNVNLSGKSLKLIDLSYSNMQGSNLEKVKFDESFLNNVLLNNSILFDAHIKSTEIVNSDLSGIKGNKIIFENCLMNNVNFSNSELTKSQFLSYSTLKISIDYYDNYINDYYNFITNKSKNGRSDFNICLYKNWFYVDSENRIKLQSLETLYKQNALLESYEYKNLNFLNSNLMSSSFTSLVLNNCNFTGAWLYGIKFNNVIVEKGSYFNKAKINRESFDRNFGEEKFQLKIMDYYQVKIDDNSVHHIKGRLNPSAYNLFKDKPYFKERLKSQFYLKIINEYPLSKSE